MATRNTTRRNTIARREQRSRNRRAIARCCRTMPSTDLRQLADLGAVWAARELATRRA